MNPDGTFIDRGARFAADDAERAIPGFYAAVFANSLRDISTWMAESIARFGEVLGGVAAAQKQDGRAVSRSRANAFKRRRAATPVRDTGELRASL